MDQVAESSGGKLYEADTFVVPVLTGTDHEMGTQYGALMADYSGLVVGLFAPPLLLSAAIGAGIGAGIGELVKKHEEKQLGVELDEYLPPGSSAIVAVVNDRYLDGVEDAVSKATKKLTKAIDSGDYDKIKEAVKKADAHIDDAIES